VNSKKADADIQAPIAFRETPPLRAEVERRLSSRPRRRETEIHGAKLDHVPGSAHDGALVVDADVVGLRQIELGLLRWNAELQLLHHLAVSGPANMLLAVITHPAIIASLA